MQLVIKNGAVVAWHGDGQDIANAYPEAAGFSVVDWPGVLPEPAEGVTTIPDPRTRQERERDEAATIPRRRAAALALDAPRLLFLLYQDRKAGSGTRFVDAVDALLVGK